MLSRRRSNIVNINVSIKLYSKSYRKSVNRVVGSVVFQWFVIHEAPKGMQFYEILCEN